MECVWDIVKNNVCHDCCVATFYIFFDILFIYFFVIGVRFSTTTSAYSANRVTNYHELGTLKMSFIAGGIR
jgi:hypothetical protein